ncbi:hypothetical protein [Shewanella sp. UCD-KL12]|uniref:hypothetical protein n=1 Tax=Shewanella sp. UCD-KL12 TaxID=1917163 RepID=UPI0009712459|nr:hypothetical protein [Shewanella sp. UCD-KL12]
MKKWPFPFKSMQSRSGEFETLTQCGSQSALSFVTGFRYRITISFIPTPYLQRFELPLNGQTFNAIGIITRGVGRRNKWQDYDKQ